MQGQAQFHMDDFYQQSDRELWRALQLAEDLHHWGLAIAQPIRGMGGGPLGTPTEKGLKWLQDNPDIGEIDPQYL